MTVVHIVLPGDIDDPASPSGGNVYDRKVCDGLTARGWLVREHPVPGLWPRPTPAEQAELHRVLNGFLENALVLVDGLVASSVPEVLAAHASRLRLVILMHLPAEDDAEGAALAAARAVVTTSEWSRNRLLELYPLQPERIHVAIPGADPQPLAPGSPSGRELLCVGAVTFHKGHDVLAEALGMIRDLSWNCVCAGSLTREPEFAQRLQLEFTGPLTGDALDAAYAKADLLVFPSRGETYGMVVTEALAHGIPVLATNIKGVPEALGQAPDGSLPGVLIRPSDPHALATALRDWLTDPVLRQRLRASAEARRTTLSSWAETSHHIAKALEAL